MTSSPNRHLWAMIAVSLACILSQTSAYAQSPTDLEDVLSLDRLWLLSYDTKDVVPFDTIWAADARLVSTEGRVKTRAEERADVTQPMPDVLAARWDVSEQEARQYGDTVIVIGRFAQSGTYDGEPFIRAYRYTNVYFRGGPGGWQLVSSQFAALPRQP